MTHFADTPASTLPFPTAGSTGMAAETQSPAHHPQAPKDEVLTRVVQSAHDTIDRLADTAAPHVQKLQEQLSCASQALSDKTGDIRATGDEMAQSLRATVRDNPLVAVGAALVLGMLVARLAR